MKKNKKIIKGIYKHYKGNKYRVLYVSAHTESGEDLVIYQDIKDESKIWARPKKMFLESVEIDGESKPRFELISEESKSDYENKYKRALADYQNLVRQSAQDKQEFVKYANEQLILEILPVFDNLKIAFNHADEDAKENGWLEGIKYVIKQFKEILENNGVQEIKTIGEKFDPDKMEAVDQEETQDKKKEDLVAKEIKAGYELNKKVINPARVVVYKYKKNL